MQTQCKTIFNNQINLYCFVGDWHFNDDLAIEINKTFDSIEQDPNALDLNLYPFLQLGFKVSDDFDELIQYLQENLSSKVIDKKSTIISFYEKYFDELVQLRVHLFLDMSLHIEDEWGPDDSWCLSPDGTVILFNEDAILGSDYTLYIKAEYFDEFKKDCLDLYKELR